MEEVCENCKYCFIDIDGEALFCMCPTRQYIVDYGDWCSDFEERTEPITQRESFWGELGEEE